MPFSRKGGIAHTASGRTRPGWYQLASRQLCGPRTQSLCELSATNRDRLAARFDKRWFPEFLHSDPPIASIGWTEDEAKDAGLQVKALAWNGPLFTDNDFSTVQREQMVIKCLLDTETDRILGCLGIGSRAAEIINLVSTAMANRITAHEVANLSVVHPSATEVLVRILREHSYGRERQQIFAVNN
jgi:pyruvate/2-oxoglutarate dehydrogenase complex dihydrolipoamide dehydrogenase (E3) component